MTGPLRTALRDFYESDGFFLAAGLSFYVVICIVPFVLLLVAGGAFLVSDDMALRQLLDRLAAILPAYQQEMESMVRGVIEARGVGSAVGTATLLLFASQLFAATRLVLNRMLRIKGRGLIHGMLFDLGMIVLLAVLFLVTVVVTWAYAWVRGIALLGGSSSFILRALHWGGLGLALAFDITLFVVLYRFVPNVRVAWTNVLVGSLATAVLWQLAKQAFGYYITRIGVFSAVYGSLGATIALIMWIYYSAIVFVLGAALIRALEERPAARAAPV